MVIGLTITYATVVAMLFVGVPVTAYRLRPWNRAHGRASAWLAAVILASQVPGIALYGLYFDARPLFEEELAPPLANQLAPNLYATMSTAAVLSALAIAAWRLTVVPVAESLRTTPAFPRMTAQAATDSLPVAAAIGVALALVSAATAWGLDVEHADPLAKAAIFPDMPDSRVLAAALAACAGIGAAISEEMLFRGILQRGLVQRFGSAPLAIALTSLVWACGHALGTPSPIWSVAEVAVMGMVFGALAYRGSVESSITAHIAFNLVAVAVLA